MSAPFIRFDSFVTQLAMGVFANLLTADTDVLKVYLSDTTPNVGTMSRKADLPEINGGHGYTAGGHDAQQGAMRIGGMITVAGVDILLEAVGGLIGPFRYAVLYDDTVAGDPLIGYWDYGRSTTLQEGETLVMDFGDALFRIGG